MSEGLKIALTALLTIGTFVIGQIIQRIVIEPIQEQRRIRGRIANALSLYQNAWLFMASYDTKPDAKARLDEASKVLHGLAADLRASVVVLPMYRVWEFTRLVIKRKDVWNVADQFLQWGGFADKDAAYVARLAIMVLLDINFGPVRSETDAIKPGEPQKSQQA